jgi:hypothetical protein
MSGRSGAVITSGKFVSPDFGPDRENTVTKGLAAMMIVVSKLYLLDACASYAEKVLVNSNCGKTETYHSVPSLKDPNFIRR